MSVLGLTGNLATGKSMVLKLLKDKRAKVFDADQRIHSYYRNRKGPVYKKVVAVFPECLSGGVISRKKLRTIIFSNRVKLKKLEKIVEYFTKYISKSFEDKRLKNKKKYFNSRGLIKPIEIEIEQLVDIIKKEMPQEAFVYGADDLKYKYKLREKSFNYQKFDLSNYPEEIEEAMRLASMY